MARIVLSLVEDRGAAWVKDWSVRADERSSARGGGDVRVKLSCGGWRLAALGLRRCQSPPSFSKRECTCPMVPFAGLRLLCWSVPQDDFLEAFKTLEQSKKGPRWSRSSSSGCSGFCFDQSCFVCVERGKPALGRVVL